MALGLSKGSEKSASNSNFQNSTTDTLDPRLTGTIYDNLNTLKTGGGYKPYTGPMVADFNSDQLTAQDQARTAAGANIGGGTLADAIRAASAGSSYQPASVTGKGYDPFVASSVGIDRGDIRNVDGQQVGAEDIARFMNPYEDTVVKNSLADLDRQRQLAQRDNSAAATHAGAFRGTSLFGMRDNTDDTFARAAGNTAGQLRYQGFNSATGNAQQDAGRALQADALNQGQDASVASQNANFQQQSALDRAGREDAAAQFGAGQDYNAQTFNAGMGEQAANRGLAGAGVLSGLAGQERDFGLGNIGILGAVGDARQTNDQARLDAAADEYRAGEGGRMDWQNMINQYIASIPQTGTRTSSGTEASKSKAKGTNASASFS